MKKILMGIIFVVLCSQMILAKEIPRCGSGYILDRTTYECVEVGSGVVFEPCVFDKECPPDMVCSDGVCIDIEQAKEYEYNKSSEQSDSFTPYIIVFLLAIIVVLMLKINARSKKGGKK